MEYWKEQIADILTEKIQNFEMTTESKEGMRGQVESILHTLIDEVDRVVRKENEGKWFGMKQKITDNLIDIQGFKAKVPQFTDRILEQLEDEESLEKVKEYILNRVVELSGQSISKVDRTYYDQILKRYQCYNGKDCLPYLEGRINELTESNYIHFFIIIASILLLFIAGFLISPEASGNYSYLMILACCVLLFGGISTPMIDVDARIDQLTFTLLGEDLLFNNQVLFFQSKSITDVVQILIQAGQLESILVGVLVLLFSVLFPFIKLIASAFYVGKKGQIQNNKLLNFFVFRSSKWSMADVMVVAIFMAYIGFSGIINSQLNQLNRSGDVAVKVFSTDHSSLELGFLLFTLFCLSSLFLSLYIEKKVKTL